MSLDRQKNFRLSAAESELLSREVKKTGLTESQWLRLIVLTALGESALSEQLHRVAEQRSSRRRTKSAGPGTDSKTKASARKRSAR